MCMQKNSLRDPKRAYVFPTWNDCATLSIYILLLSQTWFYGMLLDSLHTNPFPLFPRLTFLTDYWSQRSGAEHMVVGSCMGIEWALSGQQAGNERGKMYKKCLYLKYCYHIWSLIFISHRDSPCTLCIVPCIVTFSVLLINVVSTISHTWHKVCHLWTIPTWNICLLYT